jgi:hypothetical protein
MRAVRDLPERQRDAVVLRELEGRSYEEIAAALGVTGGAVRQLLNRARTNLRAAATAVTPLGLAELSAGGVAGAGGLTAAAKLGTALVVAGAVAGGTTGAGPLPNVIGGGPSRGDDQAVAAEADAAPGGGGVWAPHAETLWTARSFFPKVYPRLVEILQLVGSSSLMAIPTEATFESGIGTEAETYFQSATLGGKERVRLFRLAWDIACSAFAGRQVLYERFFTGDPIRNPATRYLGYDKSEAVALAEALLGRGGAGSPLPLGEG